jgi:predicted transposase/invertase (TIGR01784 family)
MSDGINFEHTDDAQRSFAEEPGRRFDYDCFWKDFIERFFYHLLKRALPELYGEADKDTQPRFLDKEFRDILNTADPEIHGNPHFADYVLEVPMKDGGAEWVTFHIEIQGRGGDIAVRMYHYKCLIYAHYRREPAALAILTERRPKNEPSYYSHRRFGTESVYRFNVLALMDLDDGELMASDNAADLVLYAAKCSRDSKGELQKYNYLRKAMGLLSERGWGRDDKRDLLLFIERIMNLTDKSLVAQYVEFRQKLSEEGKIVHLYLGEREEAEKIWKSGIEEGIEKGKLEGRLEGKLEVARNLLVNGVSPDIIAKSAGLPQEKIRELMN